jgi:hypothetical protein
MLTSFVTTQVLTPPITQPIIVLTQTVPPIVTVDSATIPSLTSTSSVPKVTSTSLISPLITPPPRLTAVQQSIFVRTLLTANDNCPLPCWWGLIPGKSTYEESKKFFVQRGIPGGESFSGDVLLAGGAESEESIEYLLRIRLTVRDDVVMSVSVDSEPYSKRSIPSSFTKDWAVYTWSAIMAHYGRPSHVTISTEWPAERGAPFIYSLSLFYAEKGIEVQYSGLVTKYLASEKKALVCPRFPNIHAIRLNLVSPISESLSGTQQHEGDLERETGMSVDAFYDAYRSVGSQSCLLVAPQ